MENNMKCEFKQCFECSAKADHEHHVVPKSLGGNKTVWLCEACHSKIYNLSMMDHRELVKASVNRRRSAGLYVGGISYGFKLVNQMLEENPEEQRIIILIVELYHNGVSYRAIARQLNEKQIPSKTGRPWHNSHIPKIIEKFYDSQKRRKDAERLSN